MTCSTSRIPCVVPFCRRTKRATPGATYFTDAPEWICGDHWRLVPRADRAIYRRAYRKALRAGKCWPAIVRLWRRVRRIAIERAGGI